MKAVSNTTPLRYLIAIEQEHMLGQLFEKVFVPVAVHEELTASRTPETVRGRVLSMPAWLEEVSVGNSARDEETRRRAYEIYLERGEQPGRDLDDWLQAERELEHGVVRRARAAG
jgi:predicted nucleic acid-binding protein